MPREWEVTVVMTITAETADDAGEIAVRGLREGVDDIGEIEEAYVDEVHDTDAPLENVANVPTAKRYGKS